MKPCVILKIVALALGLGFTASLPAHSQISGTITAPGFEPQGPDRAAESPEELATAAEAAIERGDHREAFSNYMSICAYAEGWACLRAAELLKNAPELQPDRYSEIGLYEMACSLGEDNGCDRVRKAFDETDTACAQNDADACMANAMLRLHNLIEISYTPKTAAKFLRKACDQGRGSACTELGFLYALGKGVNEDQAQAAHMFERGCTKANAIDCNRIAEAFLRGRPMAMDVQRAAEYFAQGCDYGDMFSCQKLGYAYLNGTFVDADAKQARTYLQRACDAGAVAVCKDLPAPG